ncbi:hypothetical protein G9A89_012683 [Geosiphon pyriformis]|nr:hypothetical protein G9A89_012683 [Geosiphon pyriformis]
MSTLNTTSTFGHFLFQSKQRKKNLLGSYDTYFEGFKSQSPMPSGLRLLLPQPDFGTTLPTQNNRNSDLINQPNLSPVIIIDQPPINPIAKPISPPFQLLSQQPIQQQPLQQSPQQSNLDPMAYAPIAKLDNFTGKEDDTQVWLNDVRKAITANRWNDAQAIQAIPYFFNNTADLWYQSLINKPQDFNAFKILNQFIHGLHSSILQHIHPLHPDIFQDAVTRARDFESAESEANYAQAINLVMNKSSELDSKLEKFSETIHQKIEGYLANNNQTIYQTLQQCNNQGNFNHSQNQPRLSSSTNQHTISNCLPANNAAANLSTANIPTTSLSTAVPNNLSAPTTSDILTAATINLSILNINPNPAKSSYYNIRKPEIQNYSKLEIGNSCSSTDSQLLSPTNRITFSEFGNWVCPKPEFPKLFKSLATVTEDESLAAIFSFKIKEPSEVPLFSKATLEKKSIITIYIDAKINGHSIKLILNSGSAGSIITRQLMDQLGYQVDQAASVRIITADGTTKTPIGEIDNLPIKINGIIVPIKVLVMETTQYQALIDNNWLFKTNVTLDWTTQELQISQNGQHAQVPVMCRHFRPSHVMPTPLIDFEEEEKKPTWEAYQVLWTNKEHNKLLLILFWEWEENNQGKEKRKEKEKETTPTSTTIYNSYTDPLPPTNYHRPKLICVDCGKKLSSMGACCGDNEKYATECGITFLAEEEHATNCANTRFLLATGLGKGHQLKLLREGPCTLAKIEDMLSEEIRTCDLIYNLPPCMIYTIPEKEEPISSYALESESIFDSNSNSDNDDDKKTGSSSIQNGNNNDYNSNSDSNSDSKYEQYITLPDLTKEQKLK